MPTLSAEAIEIAHQVVSALFFFYAVHDFLHGGAGPREERSR